MFAVCVSFTFDGDHLFALAGCFESIAVAGACDPVYRHANAHRGRRSRRLSLFERRGPLAFERLLIPDQWDRADQVITGRTVHAGALLDLSQIVDGADHVGQRNLRIHG